MAILIPNFALAEKIGERLEIDAATVEELVRAGIARYGEPFRAASTRAAILVNGRAVSHLRRGKTPLGPSDTVWFVLPSGGG
jgi:molybdopterin converting factor small subunit